MTKKILWALVVLEVQGFYVKKKYSKAQKCSKNPYSSKTPCKVFLMQWYENTQRYKY